MGKGWLLVDLDTSAVERHPVPAARAVLAEVDGRDWWNVKCGSLSHGMAKRVQLAQALIGDPEVVLLDEPWAKDGKILVLEPRRLAARAAASKSCLKRS